jgi:hypothetical protein
MFVVYWTWLLMPRGLSTVNCGVRLTKVKLVMAGAWTDPATLVTPVCSGSSQSRKRSVGCVPLAQATENFP